jgi:hypothetical protein
VTKPPATFLVTRIGLAMISAPIAAPPMISSSDGCHKAPSWPPCTANPQDATENDDDADD